MAIAPIQSLAWEPSYAASMALKKQNKQTKQFTVLPIIVLEFPFLLFAEFLIIAFLTDMR